MYKHRNCIIENTPTEKFPDMVTITKTPKLRDYFLDRRYLTIEHAHKEIERFESERLINSKLFPLFTASLVGGHPLVGG